MQGPLHPLPASPVRVVVAGVSGAGKSTLCRRIATIADLAYTEIDGLFHGENWKRRNDFVADVARFTSGPRWVTEWQYNDARSMLSERADTLVWLDLPGAVVLSRVIRRTVRRRLTRERLWNGNVEPALWHSVFAREGIIHWAIATRRDYRTSVPEAERLHPQLTVVRLRSQREVEAWVAGPLSDSVER